MAIAKTFSISVAALIASSTLTFAADGEAHVADDIVAAQRAALQAATDGKGYGPQAPRDLTMLDGENDRIFAEAPPASEMNLCNIHFHENAEHKGGEFTTFAGNGDGSGYGSGYKYDGELTEAELAPYEAEVGKHDHGDLEPGDTVEIHFVHSTAQVEPGPTLNSCVSEAIANPQLRVETVVGVLVNDREAASLTDMAEVELIDGLYQANNLPADLGDAITYAGSTTGPTYNEKGSPMQVTWSVRPKVAKIDIASVDAWLKDNEFDEDHAHGVRNLVINPELLSPIGE